VLNIYRYLFSNKISFIEEHVFNNLAALEIM